MSRAQCLHKVDRVPDSSGAMICPDCRKAWRASDYRKNYVHYMWKQISLRAKRQGIPFDLTEADIVIPERCSVLGMPLVVGTWGDTEASPSLDRFVPSLGYVRGNVAVISNHANRLKSDGTLDEYVKLVSWMRSMQAAKNT